MELFKQSRMQGLVCLMVTLFLLADHCSGLEVLGIEAGKFGASGKEVFLHNHYANPQPMEIYVLNYFSSLQG